MSFFFIVKPNRRARIISLLTDYKVKHFCAYNRIAPLKNIQISTFCPPRNIFLHKKNDFSRFRCRKQLFCGNVNLCKVGRKLCNQANFILPDTEPVATRCADSRLGLVPPPVPCLFRDCARCAGYFCPKFRQMCSMPPHEVALPTAICGLVSPASEVYCMANGACCRCR